MSRTRDLLNAIQALYQLSYTPVTHTVYHFTLPLSIACKYILQKPSVDSGASVRKYRLGYLLSHTDDSLCPNSQLRYVRNALASSLAISRFIQLLPIKRRANCSPRLLLHICKKAFSFAEKTFLDVSAIYRVAGSKLRFVLRCRQTRRRDIYTQSP